MTQTNGSGAAEPRTTLQFFDHAQGVKVNTPKGNGYSTESGSVDITFRISAPPRPKDPRRYRNTWQIEQAEKVIAGYGGQRPDPSADKKGTAEFDKAEAAILAETRRHRAEDERYARELTAHAPALMAYAQLVGLMAVFGDQRLQITIAPADQDLLPGMGITLALPDGKAADSQGDEDLVDYEDDEVEYDGDFDDEDLVEATEEVAAG